MMEPSKTEDLAWQRFKSRHLVFGKFGLVDPGLLWLDGLAHPLAGVVGQSTFNGPGSFDVVFPDALVACCLALGGAPAKDLIPFNAWIPVSVALVESNRYHPSTWRLSQQGLEVIHGLGYRTVPASIGLFDTKRRTR